MGNKIAPSLILDSQANSIFPFLPLQNWDVINTAVLTGRQISQAMKVFIVSQAGKAADVTLQSSCHSEEESVLKVRLLDLPLEIQKLQMLLLLMYSGLMMQNLVL